MSASFTPGARLGLLMLVLLASSPAFSAVLPARLAGDGWPFSAVSSILGVAATGGWLAAWAISGRTWPAYAALAFVPAWAMSEIAATPIVSPRSAVALASLVPAAAAAVFLRRSRAASQVDVGLRPFRTLLHVGGVLTATLFGCWLLVDRDLLGAIPRIVVLVAGSLACALWCFAAASGRRAARPSLESRGLQTALFAFALGAADRTVAAVAPPGSIASWAVASGRAVSMIGWCVLLGLALRSLGDARRVAGRRQQSLRVARDDIAQGMFEQQRRSDERRHDLRSLIAGIQGATTTLTRYRSYLDASEQQSLESALLAEITRLQRSINPMPELSAAFGLRTAVGPVVKAEQARGTSVRADLPEIDVVGSADATAALVQNLLTNARRHAPGANVTLSAAVAGGKLRLTVQDDGPGLPAHVRRRITALFDDEVSWPPAPDDKTPTPRQGLGLTICARLAHEQGGRLRLVDTGGGTTIELVLQRAGEHLVDATDDLELTGVR